MNCPGCQKSLPDEFKFCPHCGVQVVNNCISCGKQTDPTWVSCPHCGTALKSRPNQQFPVNQPPPPQPQPQQYQQPPYQHGYHQGSSSRKQRKKGFLGRMFSA